MNSMTPKQWAMSVLGGNAVILDAETTGLGISDQVIQISIIDMQGRTLFDSLISPSCPISDGAAAVHGITEAILVGAPTFKDVHPQIVDILTGKLIVTYNSDFDYRMLYQSSEARGVSTWWLERQRFACAMREYSRFVAEPRRGGGYKWQKLTGGDHSALGDCLATLEVIRRMAE